jgi:hypothetical protein
MVSGHPTGRVWGKSGGRVFVEKCRFGGLKRKRNWGSFQKRKDFGVFFWQANYF